MSEEHQSPVQIPLSERLARFLQINPESHLVLQDEHTLIDRPWGDDSIQIEVSSDNSSLIDALNNLILPPTLTAIYHTDTQILEFIFSIRPTEDPLRFRQFDFTYETATLNCRYGDSSERLMLIAQAMIPLRPISPTEHRNLRVFADYARHDDLPERIRAYFENRSPISFFIGPIEIASTDQIHAIARSLNFHMFYYDRDTPQIVIHSEEASHAAIFEDPKQDDRPFPDSLIANPVDPHMMDLWASAITSTARLAFLYYYQILEYAAFYYVDEEVRHNIARVLRRPDVLSSLDTCLTLVVDELVEYRLPDEQKLSAVIQRSVRSEDVWRVVSRFQNHFAEPMQFDGGFELPPLVRPEWGDKDFATAWIPKVPDALRKVRNALVHSREYRLGHTIAPTRANQERLMPWVYLAEEISTQVALFHTL